MIRIFFLAAVLSGLGSGTVLAQDRLPSLDLKKHNTQSFGGESSPDVSRMKDKSGLNAAPLQNRSGMPTAGTFSDPVGRGGSSGTASQPNSIQGGAPPRPVSGAATTVTGSTPVMLGSDTKVVSPPPTGGPTTPVMLGSDPPKKLPLDVPVMPPIAPEPVGKLPLDIPVMPVDPGRPGITPK